MLKAPRIPTQAEVDAHLATHLPHADWCELCMKGRGRNTPHRRRKEETPDDTPGRDDDRVASSSSLEPPAPALQPVPKISMDYFYLAGDDEEEKDRLDRITTSEMRRRLRDIGRSDAGTRNVLKKRLRHYSQDKGKEENE